MNPVAALLAPLFLLLPAAVAVDLHGDGKPRSFEVRDLPKSELTGPMSPFPAWFAQAEATILQGTAEGLRDDNAQQVRIEQRMTIRISPRSAAPAPNQFVAIPDEEAPRFQERKMGKCVSVAGIAGVGMGDDNRLILFMRDHRVVTAGLERACHARDFYSGFYVERSADGMICTDRDKLQSRAGMNCAVTRLRQLVEAND